MALFSKKFFTENENCHESITPTHSIPRPPYPPYNVEQEKCDFHRGNGGISHFMVSSTLYGGTGVRKF